MPRPPAPFNGLTSQRLPAQPSAIGNASRVLDTARQGRPAARETSATNKGSRASFNAESSFPHSSRSRLISRTSRGWFSKPPVYIHGPAGALRSASTNAPGYFPRTETTSQSRCKSRSAKRSAHQGRRPARSAENAAARVLAPNNKTRGLCSTRAFLAVHPPADYTNSRSARQNFRREEQPC
jgi:hypothetical protein